MTPISVPAVAPAQARTPAPAAPRGARRNEQQRAATAEEQQTDASLDGLEEPGPESPVPEQAPVRRGPWLFNRILVWIFARPKKLARLTAGDRTETPHGRWRRYALGCYGLIVVVTLAGQLYSQNPLGVYVKVQRVDLPKSTLVLVRNDSRSPWKHVRIRLNGIYTHTRDEIGPGDSLPLDVDKMFAITDGMGRVLRRPAKDLPIESLTLDCDSGHFETELK